VAPSTPAPEAIVHLARVFERDDELNNDT